MNRTKYVFLIFAFIYAGVAVGGMFSILVINESVLLGLSISSLFISLADAINNYCRIRALRNDYNYALSVASDYLQNRIEEGCLSVGNFDVCNIKYGIDVLKTCANPVHPVEYNKKKFLKYGNVTSTVIFAIGIASFVILPFIRTGTEIGIARFITVIAFASMCGNLFLNDLENDIIQNKYLFDSDKQSLISSLFPNYMNEYLFCTQHLASFNEAKKKKEADSTV